MKNFLTSLLLLSLIGCSQLNESFFGKEPLRVQFPIYRFANEIIVRCAGEFCPTPIPQELKPLYATRGLAPGLYSFGTKDGFTTARLLNTTGVINSESERKLIPYNPDDDECYKYQSAGFECSPNFEAKAYMTPNDTFHVEQWSERFTKLIEAWNAQNTSIDVYIFVMDSGVSLHPDLYIRPDLSFSADGSSPFNDLNGHGTHVAGIAAATGNNSIGIAGATWKTNLASLKFLGANGSGSLYDAIKAVDYLTALVKEKGLKRVIINASWGSSGYSKPLESSFRAASEAGILVVAAAGNDGSDNDSFQHYPSGFKLPGLISVASIDPDGKLASYSNFGLSSVDIAAPGSSIKSTYKGGGYADLSGTSMASPLVAGIAALTWQANPGLTNIALKSRLLSTASSRVVLAKKISSGRQIDAEASLKGKPALCKKKKFKSCMELCGTKKPCRLKCRVAWSCWR